MIFWSATLKLWVVSFTSFVWKWPHHTSSGGVPGSLFFLCRGTPPSARNLHFSAHFSWYAWIIFFIISVSSDIIDIEIFDIFGGIISISEAFISTVIQRKMKQSAIWMKNIFHVLAGGSGILKIRIFSISPHSYRKTNCTFPLSKFLLKNQITFQKHV